MKKISIISLVAVLAATPMMAQAAGRTVSKANYAGPSQTSTNVASTSYVQGAYKAASDRIDALVDDTAVAAKEGGYKAIVAGESVGYNLVALDSAVASATSAASTALTSAINDLDAEVSANSTTDDVLVTVTEANGVLTGVSATINDSAVTTGKINDGAVTTGKIANGTILVEDMNAAAVVTSTDTFHAASQASDTALVTEKAVATKIDAINSAASGLASDVAANTSAIALLNSDATQSGSVAYAVKQEEDARKAAISAMDANLSSTTGGLTLNLTEVDGVVTAISGSIASETYDAFGAAASAETAAKAYVDNTTLTVFTTWGSDASNNIKMNTEQNIANSTANTVVPAAQGGE